MCEVSAVVVIVVTTVPKFQIIPNPLPPNFDARSCLILGAPALFSNCWCVKVRKTSSRGAQMSLCGRIPALVFQSILFILVVAKFVKAKLHAGGNSPHLLVVFVRDGIWAFALIFGQSGVAFRVFTFIFEGVDILSTAMLLWSSLSYKLTVDKGNIALA
jgi:hypothetical protein